MDVAIIDYKMGNLHSVQAACTHVGLKSEITDDHNKILEAKISILPGVGAYGEAMKQLEDANLIKTINSFIDSGKIFVGICLGLQLLFERSDEFGSYHGLGLINGVVKKFDFNLSKNGRYPVPHVGWNKIAKKNIEWGNTLLCSNFNHDYMYFVHSYYVEPENKDIILTETQYGSKTYCSAISYKNIFATQFHPEKSGKDGMKIYKQLKEKI